MALVVLFACGDMRQDELDCEEAVSHLQSCLPGVRFERYPVRLRGGMRGQYPPLHLDPAEPVHPRRGLLEARDDRGVHPCTGRVARDDGRHAGCHVGRDGVPMRRAAIAMGMALATVSSQAGADEPQATEEGAVAKNTTEFVGRLAIAGAYRRLYDLDILGMGPQLSLGFERDGATVLFNLRFIDARTGAGLVVYETTGDFSVEGKLAEGFPWGPTVEAGLRF